MKVINIKKATDWFEILQTTERVQTAMMTLAPGAASGEKAQAHEKSDQILLLLDGELTGEVGNERAHLRKGDMIMIQAGTKHRFSNGSTRSSVTFNVYVPPAYGAGTR